MILSTHAIVGGAIASLFPSHPALVVAAGFASHFAIDAIPHWDYPLQAISVRPGAGSAALNLDSRLWIDLTLIALDACAGLALAIWLFATPATMAAILLGALAAMVPDPLQVVHALYPREPLKSLQRFHQWIHAKRKLSWPLGASSQAIFAAAVSGIAIVLG
jgi:hypothetical protein